IDLRVGKFGGARGGLRRLWVEGRQASRYRGREHSSLPVRIPLMSSLFSPIQLRGLKLANRIMVAPMCQYSSVDGDANDWHFTHINTLALSGAAMFCIEATGVEAVGRITRGCLGLYDDATEAALKPIMA